MDSRWRREMWASDDVRHNQFSENELVSWTGTGTLPDDGEHKASISLMAAKWYCSSHLVLYIRGESSFDHGRRFMVGIRHFACTVVSSNYLHSPLTFCNFLDV